MKYREAREGRSQSPRQAVGIAIVAWRGARLVSHLIYGTLLAAWFPLFKLSARRALLRHWSRALLNVLHVRLEITGHTLLPDHPGALLVANHISWLDVFVVSAASPSCFVAKSEVQRWPWVGLLCSLTGTIFIARRLRRDTLRANREIANSIRRGQCVTLFPEGTSTDGSGVRHFHSSLLQCAIDEACPVHPIAIRYHDGTGRRNNVANFIDDITLVRSLLNVLGSNSLHATLAYLPPASAAGRNRRELAAEAEFAIRSALDAFAPPEIHADVPTADTHLPYSPPLPIQSAYSLLLTPIIDKPGKYPAP